MGVDSFDRILQWRKSEVVTSEVISHKSNWVEKRLLRVERRVGCGELDGVTERKRKIDSIKQ